MGYEVKFTYHERLEAGGYDKDNIKEMTRKVGEPFDDTPLDKLVSVIMSQLARRDIWVVGVAPVEYSRKEISFRETDGGIVLKNKKFTFDQQCGSITCQEIQQPATQVAQQPHEVRHPHETIHNRPGQNLVVQQGNKRQKRVVFAPADPRRRLAGFTLDKEYTVLSERMKPNNVGVLLVLLDDSGNQQEVTDELFVPTSVELYADRELGFTKPPPSQQSAGNLNWYGAIDDKIPDVRRK